MSLRGAPRAARKRRQFRLKDDHYAFPFGRALRALAAAAVLCAAITPASAHEGHDHEEQQPVSAGALPRGEADSDAFEIVAIVRGENLEIYLDRFATNEPVTGATLEVESPDGPVKAAASADGTYRVAAPWLAKSGRRDLIFTVTAGDTTDILAADDSVCARGSAKRPAAGCGCRRTYQQGFGSSCPRRRADRGAARCHRTAPSGAGRQPWSCSFLYSWARASRKRIKATATRRKRRQIAISTVSGERAQRLSDGAVFVPKTVQRIFALRTLVRRKREHRKVTELPGRIIPDPNASGYVQSAVGGRLSPPPGGFPRLGTR
jgi:hypothetical protein